MKNLCSYFENVDNLSHAFLIGNVFFSEIKDDLTELISSKIIKEKIDILNNPDIYYLDQNTSLITKEEIKELLMNLSTTSQFNNVKIYIINGAEKMSDTVSNAMLKTLEESKENIYAFLITKNIESVKETIKSRCQKIVLNIDETNFENDEEIEEKVNKIIKYIEINKVKSIAINNDIYNLIEDRDIFKKILNSMLVKYKNTLKNKIDNEKEMKENSEILKNNDIITLSKKILVINEIMNLLDNYLNKNLTIDRFIIEMWRCEQ